MANKDKKNAPKRTPEKLLYSRDEVAYVLGLSDRTVDRLISNQVVTTRRFGRRVLIPAADVYNVRDLIMRDRLLHGSKPPSAQEH